MKTEEILERLERAVMLESDDAAIRIHAEYEPQAGLAAKVFPPTYLPVNGTRYHFEQRWDANGELSDVVMLDSYQSQANRCEAALKAKAAELGLPQLVMELDVDGRSVQVSSLDAPHRSRDAYFLDSEVDGVSFDKTDAGQALNAATVDDATAFLKFAPYDLVFGVWDSHRGKRMALKFPRSYTSEILGWQAHSGRKAATKGDPLNLKGDDLVPSQEWRPQMTTKQGKKQNLKLNELGHGMIPNPVDSEIGGVSVRAITRECVLSLTGLARYTFPVNGADATRKGRAALAALALAGDRLAFGRAGLSLRSGCDLVLTSERIQWVGRGAEGEPLALTSSDAVALAAAARSRLAEAGVPWVVNPIVVSPKALLRDAIKLAFAVAEVDEGS